MDKEEKLSLDLDKIIDDYSKELEKIDKINKDNNELLKCMNEIIYLVYKDVIENYIVGCNSLERIHSKLDENVIKIKNIIADNQLKYNLIKRVKNKNKEV